MQGLFVSPRRPSDLLSNNLNTENVEVRSYAQIQSEHIDTHNPNMSLYKPIASTPSPHQEKDTQLDYNFNYVNGITKAAATTHNGS